MRYQFAFRLQPTLRNESHGLLGGNPVFRLITDHLPQDFFQDLGLVALYPRSRLHELPARWRPILRAPYLLPIFIEVFFSLALIPHTPIPIRQFSDRQNHLSEHLFPHTKVRRE